MTKEFESMNELQLYREILKQHNSITTLVKSKAMNSTQAGKAYCILAQNLFSIGYNDEADQMLSQIDDSYFQDTLPEDLAESATLALMVISRDESADPTNQREFLESTKFLLVKLQSLNHPMFERVNTAMEAAKDIYLKKLGY